jgi:hypothetical protein
MEKTNDQFFAEEIEEIIMKMQAEAVLEEILESIRAVKGRDSVVIKETNYTIKE